MVNWTTTEKAHKLQDKPLKVELTMKILGLGKNEFQFQIYNAQSYAAIILFSQEQYNSEKQLILMAFCKPSSSNITSIK